MCENDEYRKYYGPKKGEREKENQQTIFSFIRIKFVGANLLGIYANGTTNSRRDEMRTTRYLVLLRCFCCCPVFNSL